MSRADLGLTRAAMIPRALGGPDPLPSPANLDKDPPTLGAIVADHLKTHATHRAVAAAVLAARNLHPGVEPDFGGRFLFQPNPWLHCSYSCLKSRITPSTPIART